MKKLFLILVISLIPLLLSSQTINRAYDKLTGDRIAYTSLTEVESLSALKTQFQFIKYSSGDMLLKLVVIFSNLDEIDYSIIEGSELWLKLGKGSVIALENIYTIPFYQANDNFEKGSGNEDGVGTESLQGYTLHYAGLTNRDIKNIAQQSVHKIRIHTTDGYRDAVVKVDGMKKMTNAAKLMLKTETIKKQTF